MPPVGSFGELAVERPENPDLDEQTDVFEEAGRVEICAMCGGMRAEESGMTPCPMCGGIRAEESDMKPFAGKCACFGEYCRCELMRAEGSEITLRAELAEEPDEPNESAAIEAETRY